MKMNENKAIKVALLGSRGVPARYGAFELCADRIATLGGKSKVHWTVYCPRKEAELESYGNADLIYINQKKSGFGALLFDVLSLFDASVKKFDCLVMLGYGAGIFLVIPRLFGRKLITNTDGFEYKRSKWSLWVKVWFRFAEMCAAVISNKLISDSLHIVNYYKDRYMKESTFIAYGTDIPDINDKRCKKQLHDFFSCHKIEPKGYHVVVMRMEPENNILEICQAAVNRGTGKPIVLVGPETPFFNKQVRPMINGKPSLIMAGSIYDRSLLFSIRINAYSYIHGHTVGGINPTLLESLSTGTPVIAAETPYNHEVLGSSGLYFSDIETLMRQMEYLENCPPERLDELALAVKGRLKPYFTWEAVVEQYEDLIVKTVCT